MLEEWLDLIMGIEVPHFAMLRLGHIMLHFFMDGRTHFTEVRHKDTNFADEACEPVLDPLLLLVHFGAKALLQRGL